MIDLPGIDLPGIYVFPRDPTDMPTRLPTPGPWQIRGAEPHDVPRLAEFNLAMAAETEAKALDPATVLAGVRALLGNPEAGFYLVALQNADVVGCLMVTYEWSDWRNAVFWWIQSVYVAPQFRRRGVFRQLFDHVESLAAERQNVCGLRLYVERDNRIAQRTYGSLGMNEAHYRVYELEFPGGGDAGNRRAPQQPSESPLG